MPHIRYERPRPEPWRHVKTRAPHPALRPFYFCDWCMAHAAYALSRWSLLELLEYLGSFSVLVAVIFWFAQAGDRLQQKHYQAWQVINTAQGMSGNGGRIEALEQLNADGVKLIGVDVTNAFLQGVNLPGAALRRARFDSADVRNAILRQAGLQDAHLRWTNLRGADLTNADLSGTDVTNADLTGAMLRGARMSRATLDNADLSEADLAGLMDWREIASMRGANLHGVKNAPEGFVQWAKMRGAEDAEAKTVATTQP